MIYGAACAALSQTAWQAGTPLPEIPLLTRPGPASEQKQWCGVYKSLIQCRAVTAFPVLVGELLGTRGIWELELAAEKCTPSFSGSGRFPSALRSPLTFPKSESLRVCVCVCGHLFNHIPNDFQLKSRKASKLQDCTTLSPLDKFCL